MCSAGRRGVGDAAEDGGHGELDAETAERDRAIAADQLRRQPGPRAIALPRPDPGARLVLQQMR